MRRFFLALVVSATLVAAQEAAHESAPAAGAKQEEHGGHGGTSNLGTWKWINFLLLAGGLGYLLGKNAGPFFRSRTAEIRQGLDEAARTKADADARCAAMEQRLANLDQEIERLRANARQEAAAENERLRQETGRELHRIQTQAERDIESVAKGARQELRAYSTELASGLAEKKLRLYLTPEHQDSLVRGMVRDLEKKGGRS